MNCIDDTPQDPDEVWGDLKGVRAHFLKKYDKNIIIIADMGDGGPTYFNIITSNRNNYLNNQRKGILLYKK